MPVNVNQQTIVFLMCFLMGIASGIIFDFINTTAKKLRFNKSAFFIQDIFVWMIILCFFFSVLYSINGASVRWYVFLGAGLGAIIYILVFRNSTLRGISFMLDKTTFLLLLIIRILLVPARKIGALLRPVGRYVQNKQKKLCKFVQKNIEKIGRIRVLLKKV